MIRIKYSVSFSLEVKKNDTTGYCRVRCVVTWNRNRLRLSTPYTVSISGWDKVSQRCRQRTMHGKNKVPAATVNHSLNEIEDVIHRIFFDFESKDEMPSKEDFQRAYNIMCGLEDRIQTADAPLFNYFDEFMSDRVANGEWKDATILRYRSLRNHLMRISPTLSLSRIIKEGDVLFKTYFAENPGLPDGTSNSSIRTYLGSIKAFIRWAHRKGYCNASKYLDSATKLKIVKKPVVFLTWEELMTVYQYDFDKVSGSRCLECVRDMFCFSCFTSLRFSDVQNLKWSSIRDGGIHVTTIKTGQSVVIDLNRYSRAILRKYEDLNLQGDKVFPGITNVYMNKLLHKIGKICGIASPIDIVIYRGSKRFERSYRKYELLSTHCGRRTFVCNALAMGIPANVVMQWTGHSNYSAMLPYIAIADKVRKDAMARFDRINNSPVNPEDENQQE